jgi:hypothetical protein
MDAQMERLIFFIKPKAKEENMKRRKRTSDILLQNFWRKKFNPL